MIPYQYTFRLELTHGQNIRHVEADAYFYDKSWLTFYRKSEVYWRANRDFVVSMEVKRNTGEAK